MTAVARKLVTTAYLMLRNNQPYRYAVVTQVTRLHWPAVDRHREPRPR